MWRIKIRTKHENNNNGSAKHTNKTDDCSGITSKVVSRNHLFLDYFVIIAPQAGDLIALWTVREVAQGLFKLHYS
jgi:hypothetical protein